MKLLREEDTSSLSSPRKTSWGTELHRSPAKDRGPSHLAGSATPVAGQAQLNQVIVKTVEKILNTRGMQEGVQLGDPPVTVVKKPGFWLSVCRRQARMNSLDTEPEVGADAVEEEEVLGIYSVTPKIVGCQIRNGQQESNQQDMTPPFSSILQPNAMHATRILDTNLVESYTSQLECSEPSLTATSTPWQQYDWRLSTNIVT